MGEKVLCHKLSNGVLVPVVSLGTWQVSPEDCERVVTGALNCGYRGIDTAWVYKNESAIGKVVRSYDMKARTGLPPSDPKPLNPHGGGSAVIVAGEEFKAAFKLPETHPAPTDDREVFVTSKVWVDFFTADGVRSQVEEHLRNFERSSVDLMLLHWPGFHTCHPQKFSMEQMKADQWETRKTCWLAMESEYHAGRIRAIGVSNYLVKHLSQLLKWLDERKANGDTKVVYPMVNQIELSVFLHPSKELEKLCADNNILITSYSTLGGGMSASRNMQDPALKKIADKYQVDNSIIMLRWAIERGYTILPKSSHPQRVTNNLHQTLSIQLSNEDIDALNKMDKGDRNLPNPDDVN